jgi:HEAT repeat protein
MHPHEFSTLWEKKRLTFLSACYWLFSPSMALDPILLESPIIDLKNSSAPGDVDYSSALKESHLLSLLRERSLDDRMKAAKSLARTGTSETGILPLLEAFKSEEDAGVRFHLGEALVQSGGPSVVNGLTEALFHNNRFVVQTAIIALADIGGEAAASALKMTADKHPNSSIRELAAKRLSRLL